jgi:cobalamin-dependent methionine synthase I
MTLLSFGIEQLTNYINWIYFYHTWGIKESNASEIRLEADSILKKWCTEKKEVLFGVYIALANSCGEDIILHKEQEDGLLTIPLLRQQHPPFLCLSDFLPPTCMHAEKIGVFASTVPFQVEGLLEQTLADRLAEAAAELGHEIVRKDIWGYAPDENLTPKEMFAEHYRGKRPAVGYPSLPDQSINFVLSSLLDFPSLGISLTENGAMIPHASTTGLMISHPQCRHFKVGTIGEDQLADYALRRGMTPDTIRKFIDIA